MVVPGREETPLCVGLQSTYTQTYGRHDLQACKRWHADAQDLSSAYARCGAYVQEMRHPPMLVRIPRESCAPDAASKVEPVDA